ncbi:hypothetical protein [Lysobacter tyrosinilyticus]
MNTGHDHEFDLRLRQLHAQAVERVSPRTWVQLRPQRERARTVATKHHRHAWPLAATCAIALVAGGLFLRHPQQQTTEAPPAMVTTNTDNDPGDVYAALDESPELYEWLASNDTASLVTE